MSRAWLEVRNSSAFCREWRRYGGTCSAGTSSYPLPDLLGQRTGGGMSTVTAITPQTRVFAGSACEIQNVRSFVGQVIHGCPVADDIVLLASELATNAVLHTASGSDGTFSVVVRVEGTWARVEVRDLGSATAPAVRQAVVLKESGTGLSLVETIADRWGYHGGSNGRVVWFEVDWR